MVYSYLLAFGTTHFNLFLLLLYFTPSQFFFKISFSIVRKYLVAFLWSVSKKKKKTHLGIHSFSSTCLVLLFTCLVGFVFFCNYWRKKKEKRMKKCKVVMKRERDKMEIGNAGRNSLLWSSRAVLCTQLAEYVVKNCWRLIGPSGMN